MKNLFYLLSFFVIILFSSFIIFKKDTPPPVKFHARTIEKTMGQVNEKLLASKYEVTNIFYKEFLADLQRTARHKEYKIAEVQDSRWGDMVYRFGEPMMTNYSKHPAYDEYPVVNISQQGARLFCEWLTENYNETAKRKYKKVKFRLPTEAEWKEAARAGHEFAPFPWGGYYLRNSKGKFLANFRRIPQTMIKYNNQTGEVILHTDRTTQVPARFMAPVATYWPNDFGLYNMSGNVAEMLDEDGRTKGGSWASSGYFIQIDAEDEHAGFTAASPEIGFRYFMEILEE